MKKWFENKSILIKLIAGGLSTIALIGILWLILAGYFVYRNSKADEVLNTGHTIMIQMLKARNEEKNFLSRDLRKKEFYENGTTEYLNRYEGTILSLQKQIEILSQSSSLVEKQDIEKLRGLVNKYHQLFHELVASYRERGFNEWGMEGKWVKATREMEQEITKIRNANLKIQLLQLRRHEKNYLLRGERTYIEATNTALENLKKAVKASGGAASISILQLIDQYEKAFRRYVALQEKIGLTEDVGIWGEFRSAANSIEPIIDKILEDARTASDNSHQNLIKANIVILVAGLFMGVLIFYFFAQSITRPLKNVVRIAEKISASDLTVSVSSNNRHDEIGVLLISFDRMLRSLK